MISTCIGQSMNFLHMLSSTQVSLMQAISNVIDVWDWAFWNITSKWLRPCNDCTKCDHWVGYLQGSFYTCACCFWYALHVYRPPSCRCLESGQTSLIYLTLPSSYNSMQSLHDLSHWEMLAYSLSYFSSLHLAGSAAALCCLIRAALYQ